MLLPNKPTNYDVKITGPNANSVADLFSATHYETSPNAQNDQLVALVARRRSTDRCKCYNQINISIYYSIIVENIFSQQNHILRDYYFLFKTTARHSYLFVFPSYLSMP